MRFLALLLAVFLLAAPPAAAAGFVPGIEDLPLMPALSADADSEMVFDTPAGRIVQASATGTASREAVLKFYRETLPQLGWAPSGTGIFTRESEELRIEFAGGAPDPLTVKFSLKPAP